MAEPTTQIIEQPTQRLRAAVAVVGSGPGGSVSACLLAEAGRDVLLLEDGPYLPLESCAPFSRAEMVQKYRNGGVTVAMGSPKIVYVEGRCVGGGSEINIALYHRAPAEVLEEWRTDFGVEALSAADLAPHFEAIEKELCVSNLPGPAPAASLKLRDGAERLGWKCVEAPRWFRYEPGAAVGEQQGQRQSMTRTFVPRFLAAGGRLLPNTRALRLRRCGAGWSLRCEHAAPGAAPRRVDVLAETVFVAAGAIQTPALLRRSGFRRGIGNSLQMHATAKFVAEFPDEINAPGMGVPVHQVKEFSPRSSFGCSISSLPHLALALADQPDSLATLDRDWRRLAIYYAMIRGGRGSVRPLPWFRDPLVRYRLGADDLAELAQAMRRLGQCLFAAGAVALVPSITGMPRLTKESDLQQLDTLPRGRTNLMTIHLCGSCPMGADPARSAADSFGRVHGIQNLYIADASLLCTSLGTNPQGTIMAIVRRNALHFLGK